MSKRSEAKERKAKAQMFKDPARYIGQQFEVISTARPNTEIVQVFCKDKAGNEINFAFGNPAARQQNYRPGETREMSRTAQGELVDFIWLSETEVHRRR